MEGPIAHFALGLAFLAQAAVAAVFLLARDVTPRALVAYVVFLLLGWAAGVTVDETGYDLGAQRWHRTGETLPDTVLAEIRASCG